MTCKAVALDAYQKVDTTVTVWYLYKEQDPTSKDPPELVGYCFQSRYSFIDYANALFTRRREEKSKRKNKKQEMPELSDDALDRVAGSMGLLFRTDHFFVYGSPNYGILITASESNEALDEALSNNL